MDYKKDAATNVFDLPKVDLINAAWLWVPLIAGLIIGAALYAYLKNDENEAKNRFRISALVIGLLFALAGVGGFGYHLSYVNDARITEVLVNDHGYTHLKIDHHIQGSFPNVMNRTFTATTKDGHEVTGQLVHVPNTRIITVREFNTVKTDDQ